jgi:putative glutamine amidotransferase
VGISACFFHADPLRPIFKGKTLQYVEQSLARWVQSEGSLAYMVPSPAAGAAVSLRDYADDLDALVLHGGSDVSPLSYGDKPLRPEWSGDRIRDEYEIALVHEFKKQRKPVLGICRGLQLLNVAFGGTLYQDIATELPAARKHRDWDVYDTHCHSLAIESGAWLSDWYKTPGPVTINSIHHQAVKDLGQGLVVEARSSDDNIIEAVRFQGDAWIYAVQWHPEFHDTCAGTLDAKPLLNAFLDQATLRKQDTG